MFLYICPLQHSGTLIMLGSCRLRNEQDSLSICRYGDIAVCEEIVLSAGICGPRYGSRLTKIGLQVAKN